LTLCYWSLVVTTHKKTLPPSRFMGESVMSDTDFKYGSFLRALNVKPYRPFVLDF